MFNGLKAKQAAKAGVRRLGFDLRRHDPDLTYADRRLGHLLSRRVSTVLDVGAHRGEYAQALRHRGYRGRIVSFEPVSAFFNELLGHTGDDELWDCHQLALGASEGTSTIHLSGNDGFSSSMMPMTEAHLAGEPSSAYIGEEKVSVAPLDTLLASVPADGPMMLKIDSQGFEAEVLAGAEMTLGKCQILELELAFLELYEGQPLFNDLVSSMEALGFVLADLEPGFRSQESGRLLQADGLFLRSE